MDICDSDAFVDMTPSAQALYFQLCLRADDDGFINKVKRTTRDVGCSYDDPSELISNRFVLSFEDSDVIVIKHWRIHNTIRKERKTDTRYQDELATLEIKENGQKFDKKRLDLVKISRRLVKKRS